MARANPASSAADTAAAIDALAATLPPGPAADWLLTLLRHGERASSATPSPAPSTAGTEQRTSGRRKK